MVLTVFTSQQTLPEVCSEQDEMDFLMEALIIRYTLRFLYWWWAGGKGVTQVIRTVNSLAGVQKRNPAFFFTRWRFSSIWVTDFSYLFISNKVTEVRLLHICCGLMPVSSWAPHSSGMGKRIGRARLRKLMHWDKGSIIGKAKAGLVSKAT